MLYNKNFEAKIIETLKKSMERGKEVSQKNAKVRFDEEQINAIEEKYPRLVEAATSFQYSRETVEKCCCNLIGILAEEAELETLSKISLIKRLVPEEIELKAYAEVIQEVLRENLKTAPDEIFDGYTSYEMVRNAIIGKATEIVATDDVTFSAALELAIPMVTSDDYLEECISKEISKICKYFLNPLIFFVQENEEDIKDEVIAAEVTKILVKAHKEEFAQIFMLKKAASKIISKISESLMRQSPETDSMENLKMPNDDDSDDK